MATSIELRRAAEHLRRRAASMSSRGGPRQDIHAFDTASDTLEHEAARLVASEAARKHAAKKGKS